MMFLLRDRTLGEYHIMTYCMGYYMIYKWHTHDMNKQTGIGKHSYVAFDTTPCIAQQIIKIIDYILNTLWTGSIKLVQLSVINDYYNITILLPNVLLNIVTYTYKCIKHHKSNKIAEIYPSTTQHDTW